MTDSLNYEIFATAPRIFFELISQQVSTEHRFNFVEIWQTAFRIDSIFLAQDGAREFTIHFVEVHLQEDEGLY
ncbi:MAG: DUF2887 domain-containing protein [Cyanobacteria bacterium J06642_2]